MSENQNPIDKLSLVLGNVDTSDTDKAVMMENFERLQLYINNLSFGESYARDVQYKLQTAEHVVASNFPNFETVTGFELTIPKDGIFKISAECTLTTKDVNAVFADSSVHIAIDDVPIEGTRRYNSHKGSSNDKDLTTAVSINKIVSLKADNVVTLKVAHSAGDNARIRYDTTYRVGYIAYEELLNVNIKTEL